MANTGVRTKATRVRVLVVDDSELARRSICSILGTDPSVEVVCQAGDGLDAVEKAREFQPDVVILDISMPHMSGFEAARAIRRVAPHSKILFFSEHESFGHVREAMAAGGQGYVVKSDAFGELILGIKAVQDGKQYLSASVTRADS